MVEICTWCTRLSSAVQHVKRERLVNPSPTPTLAVAYKQMGQCSPQESDSGGFVDHAVHLSPLS